MVMKQVFILVLVIAAVLSAPFAFAELTGSKHDLTRDPATGKVYTRDRGAVCVFCHIPHGGAPGISRTPLWVKKQKDAQAERYYELYTWHTADGKISLNRPGSGSLNCLSCHDGTIGRNMTYDNVSQVTSYAMNDAGYPRDAYDPLIGQPPGKTIFGDHPVNIHYRGGSAGLTALKKAKKKGIAFSGTRADQVECASCHNPHASDNIYFLEKPMPALCGACHAGRSSGKHVLAGYGFGGSHPVQGKPDPLRKGKKLSCTSCHSPHASDVGSPLTDGKLTTEKLCLKCHEKIMIRDSRYRGY